MKLGMLMDHIKTIRYASDSSLLCLLESQKRHYENWHIAPENVFIKGGRAFALAQKIKVLDDEKNWYEFLAEEILPLDELDLILMRKDPPFNAEFIYLTYALELAETAGVWVINKPQSLRDANEKAFTVWFPQYTPEHLISSNLELIRSFVQEMGAAVLKPLDSKQSDAILLAKIDDLNLSTLIELSTHGGTKTIIAQRYLPGILTSGDFRITLINGKPIPYGLIRKAGQNQIRAAFRMGGGFEAFKLEKKHYELAEAIAPTLKEKGLFCVGIDVIDDLITEINVTSPSLFRQIQNLSPVNVAEVLFDEIEAFIS